MKKIIIIGGGISGLSLAYFLRKNLKSEIVIVEKEERTGGWIATHKNNGIHFELGPRGFRPSGKGKITLEFAKELGLEIISANKSAQKRYIADKKRLHLAGLGYLFKEGLIPSLLLEGFKKQKKTGDESIASFFRRRIGQKAVDKVIYPLCQGIFAADPEALSMQACFPYLKESEERYGSLTRAFFAKKKRDNLPALCSFKDGMEALPKAIAEQLQTSILFGSEVKQIEATDKGATVLLKGKSIEANKVIITTPHLFGLGSSFSQESVSLTLVHFAFSSHLLPCHGFGFVCQKACAPLLGITFDSEIFPDHNHLHQTRLCILFKGKLPKEEAIKLATETLERYLKITNQPDHLLVTYAENALYQYPVGHIQKVKELESSLPSSILLSGARFYGVAVNDCIHRSKALAGGLSN